MIQKILELSISLISAWRFILSINCWNSSKEYVVALNPSFPTITPFPVFSRSISPRSPASACLMNKDTISPTTRRGVSPSSGNKWKAMRIGRLTLSGRILCVTGFRIAGSSVRTSLSARWQQYQVISVPYLIPPRRYLVRDTPTAGWPACPGWERLHRAISWTCARCLCQ